MLKVSPRGLAASPFEAHPARKSEPQSMAAATSRQFKTIDDIFMRLFFNSKYLDMPTFQSPDDSTVKH